MIERTSKKIAGRVVALFLVAAVLGACRAPAVVPPRECELKPFLLARLSADTIDCGVFDSDHVRDFQAFLATAVAACVNDALARQQNFVLWETGIRRSDPMCNGDNVCSGFPQVCRTVECPAIIPVITAAWTGQNAGPKYRITQYRNQTILLPVATIESRTCTAAPAATFHQLQSALPSIAPSIQCSPDDHIPENELVLAPLQTLCGPPLPAPLSDANPGDTEPNDATVPPDA